MDWVYILIIKGQKFIGQVFCCRQGVKVVLGMLTALRRRSVSLGNVRWARGVRFCFVAPEIGVGVHRMYVHEKSILAQFLEVDRILVIILFELFKVQFAK
jgi:hypothetical protein